MRTQRERRADDDSARVRHTASKVPWLRVCLGLVFLLCSGALIASNMGFAITSELFPTAGCNLLALPYLPKDGVETISDLYQDIGPAVVDSIETWNASTQEHVMYTGGSGGETPLVPGQGYKICVNAYVPYRIVGSHDPAAVVTLTGVDTVPNWMNVYAPPYHTVAADAKDLMDEIGNVLRIEKVERTTGGLVIYDGATGHAFSLEPGEAYFIQLQSDVEFVPTHY